MKPTYDANAEIALAEVDIEFPKGGLSSQAQVLLSLSPVPDIRFEVLHDSPAIHSLLANDLLQNESTAVRLKTGIQVEVMPYGTSLVPVDSSVTGLDTGEPLHSVHFGLINFPDFMKQGSVESFVFDDGRKGFRVSKATQLNGPPWLVEIRAVDNIRQVQNSLSQQQGFGLTHRGSVRRCDGKSFSKESVQSVIEALRLFCSFARGVYCGLTLLTGTNQAGEPVWEQWEVSNVETWKAYRSWFDTRNGQILEDVFPGFWAQFQGFQRNDRTRIALEWYLDSNAQKALHSSIVLSQAALERLSFLQVGKNLTAKQMRRKYRETEGEWIARALSQAGVDCKIPPSCTALEQLRIANGFDHGPHTIVEIRNDLIHQDMSYGILSVDVYRQARELGLWYVEMLLLKSFDYNGIYANRLTQQWRGQVEPVPWAPTTVASP